MGRGGRMGKDGEEREGVSIWQQCLVGEFNIRYLRNADTHANAGRN